MGLFIIAVERNLVNQNNVNLIDLSHMHPHFVIARAERDGKLETIVGKYHTVHVIDTFGEFTRNECIALAVKFINKQYQRYDFDLEEWKDVK